MGNLVCTARLPEIPENVQIDLDFNKKMQEKRRQELLEDLAIHYCHRKKKDKRVQEHIKWKIAELGRLIENERREKCNRENQDLNDLFEQKDGCVYKSS